MTAFVSHTTIDCHDAYVLSEWWKQVLGYTDIPGDPNEPGDEECMIIDPDTDHRLLFIEVPDADLPAKRIHFDVRPRQGSRDDEVDRLLAHGATLVADHRGIHGPGSGWVTLSDTEGNQFCVLRSPAELNDEQRPTIASTGIVPSSQTHLSLRVRRTIRTCATSRVGATFRTPASIRSGAR